MIPVFGLLTHFFVKYISKNVYHIKVLKNTSKIELLGTSSLALRTLNRSTALEYPHISVPKNGTTADNKGQPMYILDVLSWPQFVSYLFETDLLTSNTRSYIIFHIKVSQFYKTNWLTQFLQ